MALYVDTDSAIFHFHPSGRLFDGGHLFDGGRLFDGGAYTIAFDFTNKSQV